jgi:hypothetical protein
MLRPHTKDIPFALFYVADALGTQARIAASCGVDEDARDCGGDRSLLAAAALGNPAFRRVVAPGMARQTELTILPVPTRIDRGDAFKAISSQPPSLPPSAFSRPQRWRPCPQHSGPALS